MGDFGQNKRRDPRLQYTSECLLEVELPAWAMTTQPIQGETANITAHGMRLNLPGFQRLRAERWRKAVEDHERIAVRVRLGTDPGGLSLHGQVVWFDYEDTDDAEYVFGSAGILFVVLREGEARMLRSLIESIDAGDGD